MKADFRQGTWQDTLADVEPDCLIVDAPYSERTHAAHRDGNGFTGSGHPNYRAELHYAHWDDADVFDFVASWSKRTRGWFVSITDHVLAPIWCAALEAQGRYVFSPLAYVAPGSRVRLAGDGPSQWSTWIIVARPRVKEFARWGTLPGAYILPAGQATEPGAKRKVIGGKPLWLLRSLVRDYSRPGQLVCDPCAGAATLLRAARIEGRHSVGAELDPKHYEIGAALLAKRYTPALFAETPQLRTTLPMFEDAANGDDRSGSGTIEARS
jgi:site-specific DNA-methyltransferase (adenine-specific)